MLTLLKCETCGGSSFKPHSVIDEFLVCEFCNSQYLKSVRDIDIDIPVDLKAKIDGNHSRLFVNNCVIKGNYNNIAGNYNIILGNHNKIVGKKNIAKGNYNTQT